MAPRRILARPSSGVSVIIKFVPAKNNSNQGPLSFHSCGKADTQAGNISAMFFLMGQRRPAGVDSRQEANAVFS